ncbi:tripartite tricarboxylate transporter substrate binding protein [Roseomonas sp. M0104]|uniref:Tripartite tricarboxylate transporter substrate binding protein n=1 Tax=Teichococcus coralli TaxID=2545983 RepID=A0A845BF22_9PROT|nr:tripartite tricarboxylate transporter substrate binding protein [Pseudoroseomonas coralli]MXP65428.1 tripartite tricarboxylate transporter substrate binding protein [Pseudoroseomonas coralli]
MPPSAPGLTRRGALALGTAMLAAPAIARAEAFPSRPIRLIVPWPPGGSADSQLRSLADLATAALGQTVLVENRSGARGLLGAQALLQAAPDGYTLAQHHLSVLRHPFMTQAKSWDPVEDFTPILGLTGWLFGVVVRSDSPIRSWTDYVAAARAKPGAMTYSTSGIGTSNHIAMEDICARLGIEMTHVPFRGTTEGVTALLGGQIDSIADSSAWVPQVEAGKFRLLCVWSPERAKRFPEVPTLRDLGIDLAVTSPYGIAGPKGMDPGVVRVLHDAFRKALFSTENTAIREKWDMPLSYMDTEAYRDFTARRAAYEKAMVERLKLSIDG